MYPKPFRYHRADSLANAGSMLSELGGDAQVLAGGQSLIPLMKLRLSSPSHLIDLNFISGLSYVRQAEGDIRFGAMTPHADVATSDVASKVPILLDCASGIADVQVRNRGTVGGSLAEADPNGDWAPVLLVLDTTVGCTDKTGERTVPLSDFFVDAYTTVLKHDELLREVVVKIPPPRSGGAYLAFKRNAPVYATASAAVQLTLEDGNVCKDIGIALGCLGLTAIKASEAEKELRGKQITENAIAAAADIAVQATDPQPDIRGSADYKRALTRALVKQAIDIAVWRSRGEHAEVSHHYA